MVRWTSSWLMLTAPAGNPWQHPSSAANHTPLSKVPRIALHKMNDCCDMNISLRRMDTEGAVLKLSVSACLMMSCSSGSGGSCLSPHKPHCPFCLETQLLHSRASAEHAAVRRRSKCGHELDKLGYTLQSIAKWRRSPMLAFFTAARRAFEL
jgi:hypothetical protein